MTTAMIVVCGTYCMATVVGTSAAIVSTHPNVKIKRAALATTSAAFATAFASAMVILGLAIVNP